MARFGAGVSAGVSASACVGVDVGVRLDAGLRLDVGVSVGMDDVGVRVVVGVSVHRRRRVAALRMGRACGRAGSGGCVRAEACRVVPQSASERAGGKERKGQLHQCSRRNIKGGAP